MRAIAGKVPVKTRNRHFKFKILYEKRRKHFSEYSIKSNSDYYNGE